MIGIWLGSAGIVVALLEGWRHFGDDRYGDAAIRGARELAAVAATDDNCSLYFGVTGMAVALRAVRDVLDQEWAARAAANALDRVRARMTLLVSTSVLASFRVGPNRTSGERDAS